MTQPSLTAAHRDTGHSPYAAKLGIRLIRTADDSAEYLLPFDPSNSNPYGFVHGGAMLSLADCAVTAAAWSAVRDPEHHRGLTVDLSLAFVSAARESDILARATVLRRGRSLCFCKVELRTPEQLLIAHGQATYKLQRIERPAEILQGLFADRSVKEQMALLAQLERAGAGLYQAWAAEAAAPEARHALLQAAAREEDNAGLLDALTEGAP